MRDLKLSDLLVDDVVFVDDMVNFQFKLTAAGFQGEDSRRAPPGGQAGGAGHARSDRRGGRPAAGGPLALSSQGGRPVSLSSSRPSRQEGSLRPENNRLARTIQVRKEKIRVLLVQAYPSFEYRFLRNMLRPRRNDRPHTVLQDADVEYTEQDKTALRVFPVPPRRAVRL